MAPERSRLTRKLPIRAPLVKSPTPALKLAKANVKALFDIYFGILTVSVAFCGMDRNVSEMDRNVSELWKYSGFLTVALNLSRVEPDET